MINAYLLSDLFPALLFPTHFPVSLANWPLVRIDQWEEERETAEEKKRETGYFSFSPTVSSDVCRVAPTPAKQPWHLVSLTDVIPPALRIIAALVLLTSACVPIPLLTSEVFQRLCS